MADEVAGILMARGALGCSIAEIAPVQRRPKVVTLEAYFSKVERRRVSALAKGVDQLCVAMLDNNKNNGTSEQVADPGWATMWQDRFKPLRVGKRFLIVPPWNRKSEQNRHSIVIRPGQAFGTGHHASTAGAIRAIEAIQKRGDRIEAALDVGTGSGVLAFVACRLGADRVLGIDTDLIAIKSAHDNAALNPTGCKLRFSTSPLTRVRGQFNLITANILSAVLIDLAPELCKRLARKGSLVLGGILVSEHQRVIRRYQNWLHLCDARHHLGWTTLTFSR